MPSSWQVAEATSGRGGRDAPAAAQAALEEHQRALGRWEARVARQLEKIVALQRGTRTPGGASSQATPQARLAELTQTILYSDSWPARDAFKALAGGDTPMVTGMPWHSARGAPSATRPHGPAP